MALLNGSFTLQIGHRNGCQTMFESRLRSAAESQWSILSSDTRMGDGINLGAKVRSESLGAEPPGFWGDQDTTSLILPDYPAV